MMIQDELMPMPQASLPRGLFGGTDLANMLRLLGGTLVDINNGGRTSKASDLLDQMQRLRAQHEQQAMLSRFPRRESLGPAVIGPETPWVPRPLSRTV